MLSFLYPHSRLQIRVGIFFAGNTVGAAFGGLIAYAISHINNPHFASWRYICECHMERVVVERPPLSATVYSSSIHLLQSSSKDA